MACAPWLSKTAEDLDLEEAAERRTTERKVRVRSAWNLQQEGLSISAIVERTGWARTTVVDYLHEARQAAGVPE